MNLVMIGRFKEADTAAKAKQIIDSITEQVNADMERGDIVIGSPLERYSDQMLQLLLKVDVITVTRDELEQFAYDVNVRLEDDTVVVTTEESEVSAFFKVLLAKGARVEIFSAHDYPDTGYGRGK